MNRYFSLILSLSLSLGFVLSLFLLNPTLAQPKAFRVFPIIENVGQFAPQVRFQIPAPAYTLWLTDEALWFSGPISQSVKLSFANNSGLPQLEPAMPHSARISYYRGSGPGNRFEKTPVWSVVRYTNVAPYLNLEIGTEYGRLYTKFRPTAKAKNLPPTLRFQLEGADHVQLSGNILHLQANNNEITFPLPPSLYTWKLRPHLSLPNAWYITGTLMRPVFNLQSPISNLLTPTTTLRYGSYLGGSLWDEGQAIAVDSQGRIVVAGHTQSLTFPGAKTGKHAIEGFIARFMPDGASLDYMVLFWADVEDWVNDIALDEQDNVYAVGETDSTDFPTTPNAWQTLPAGGFDAFAVKVDNSGTLAYATLLGGADTENGRAIAVDEYGNAYLGGGTWSADFPVTANAFNPQINGERDIFIAKLNADGSILEYSTFLGGSGQEQAESIALAEENNLHLVGWTRSADFPVTAGVIGPEFKGGFDAFIMQLGFTNAQTSTLKYATYLGGSGEDRALALKLDSQERPIISGRTHSADFPSTPNSFNTFYGGGVCDFAPCPDVFVSKLTPFAAGLEFSAYLGGNGWDEASSLALDDNDNIYLNGETRSNNFPVTDNAWQSQIKGEQDGFMAQIEQSGAVLTYSSYYGGSDWDNGNGISLGSDNLVYLTGKTRSTDFPVTAGAYAATLNGDYDAFVLVLGLSGASGSLPPIPTPHPHLRQFLPLIFK